MISKSLNSTLRQKTCVTKNILFLTTLDILICNKGGISPKQRLFEHVILVVGSVPGYAIVDEHRRVHVITYIQIKLDLFIVFCIVFLLHYTKSISSISPVYKSRNAISWLSECTRDSLEIKIFQGEHPRTPRKFVYTS